jgi:RimJ/RimL family protein N-acetyltransferase
MENNNTSDAEEGVPPLRINLREVTESDLPIFYEQQLDEGANYMAAFTAKDPTDRAAFEAHWTRIMGDDAITLRTVLYLDSIAGYMANFERFGKQEVSYWLGKDYWGKGIATQALSHFLSNLKKRPLYARAAKDNIASVRVLEKTRFAISGHEIAYANARGAEIEEVIMMLE